MDIETVRTFCLSKPGTTEEMLYHDDAMAFKVMDKVYLQLWISHWEAGEPRMNLKCEPNRALKLREQYPDQVKPGYHMSKKHWNTVYVNAGLDDHNIKLEITHSYEAVISGLTKKDQNQLKTITEELRK